MIANTNPERESNLSATTPETISTRRNILLAFDGSAHAVAALELVEDLFIKNPPPGACTPPHITTITVLPTQHLGGHESLQASLNQVQGRLKMAGAESTAILKAGNPPASINEYAEEIEADMIIVGAKGLRHTLGILLGGVTQSVVEYSTRPVLVVRAPYKGTRRILFATDGSPYSQKTLDYLCGKKGDMAGCCYWLPSDSQVTAMYVLPPPLSLEVPSQVWTLGPEALYPAPLTPLDRKVLDEEDEHQGQESLRAVKSTLADSGKAAETVLVRGDAATEIIKYATEHAIDLIACGSRGLSAVTGWLLGSVSRKLVHYAGCSVLIVK